MTGPKLRAAIYCRISLDKNGDELGVKRQHDEAERIAKARGWNVVAEYVDNSISAFTRTTKRPSYDEMVAAAKAGTIDAVIVWDLDRLTRQPRQLEDWCDMGEDRGFVLVTVDGAHDLSTENGRMFARIKASVARQESEHKAKRQKAANQQRAEMGKPQHSGRAFGYDLDGTIRADEADIVREVYRRFASSEGLHTITRWLADEGVMNTRGKPWTRSGVRDILTNPRYVAERWILRAKADGSRVREYVGPGTWEPIISEDIFRAVGAILNDPARREKAAAKGNARRYVGAGTYVCAVCGEPLKTAYGDVRQMKDGEVVGHTRYRKYQCPSWHVGRRADYLDEVVEAAICARLRDPAIVAAMVTEADAGTVRELRDEANGLRSRIDGIANDYADGLLNARQVKLATERAEARLQAVEAQLAQIGSANALGGVLGAPDPAAAWLALVDPRARAAVIDALCSVRVHPQPRGRRPSERNPEKLAAWAESYAATVDMDWHRESV